MVSRIRLNEALDSGRSVSFPINLVGPGLSAHFPDLSEFNRLKPSNTPKGGHTKLDVPGLGWDPDLVR